MPAQSSLAQYQIRTTNRALVLAQYLEKQLTRKSDLHSLQKTHK